MDAFIQKWQRGQAAERTQHLEREGIRVLRFENRIVLDQPEAVVSAIAAALGT